MPDSALFLGIDTGGTYTDTVLFDPARGVVGVAKALTTHGALLDGIRESFLGLRREHPFDPGHIDLVSMSTTLATNALVEGQRRRACLILIGQAPGLLDRAALRKALADDPVVFIDGGHHADGDERAPLDRGELSAAIEKHMSSVDAFAVSAQFSVRNPLHELTARELIRARTGLPVTCGHELSARLDAPRRSLTALLNARLIPLITELIRAMQTMLEEAGIAAPLMVVRGDGSLINASIALERPIETILSGPAASVVGALHLTGERNAIVADMGGTTTDIALLSEGAPRRSASGAVVGGWRTMVEAVEVFTTGLGGDSELHRQAGGELALGPQRAVPLCLATALHPEIAQALRSELQSPPDHRQACFALRSALGAPHPSMLTQLERKLWQMLAQGPVAFTKLLDDPRLERPMERMRQRGLISVAAFTPTDAAHLLGIQPGWTNDAPDLAARLWIRRLESSGVHWIRDPRRFAQHVIDLTVADSGRAVANAVIADRTGILPGTRHDLGHFLIGQATLPNGDLTPGFNLRFTLRDPIVAVGAPAATYYPKVSSVLGTRAVIPEHAGVCNAVGAVAGSVSEHVIVTVTSPAEGVFRVHAASGMQDFPELAAAIAYAEDEAKRTASDAARRAGGSGIEVSTARHDNVVTDPAGRPVFLESTVTATAVSRPRTRTRGN